MKKEQSDDDLKNLPPFLQDLKEKGEGFAVPEGYFEQLENAVFARLETSGTLRRPAMRVEKGLSRFPLSVRPKMAMALAAALALILTAIWFFRQPTAAIPENAYAVSELTEEDIEAYVLENVAEFEPEQLVALTPETTGDAAHEQIAPPTKKNSTRAYEIHPDDLDKILDEMTDEELEQIL